MTVPAALPKAEFLGAAEAARRGSLPIDRPSLIAALALVLPAVAAIAHAAAASVTLIAVSLVLSGAWTMVFALVRKRRPSLFFIPAAIVFALLVPPGIPYWQATLALTFGVVVGEQIFGGRGYAFLHPAVAALAFLFFSFPGSATEANMPVTVSIAAVPGIFLLLAAGLVAWRTIASLTIGLLVWHLIKGAPLDWQVLSAPVLVLGVFFLMCDPPTGAVTNAGRIIHGFFCGMLLVILGEAGAGVASGAAVVFTALLGSIFAPLFDRAILAVNMRNRRRRLGKI